jgi:hypothetical protein
VSDFSFSFLSLFFPVTPPHGTRWKPWLAAAYHGQDCGATDQGHRLLSAAACASVPRGFRLTKLPEREGRSRCRRCGKYVGMVIQVRVFEIWRVWIWGWFFTHGLHPYSIRIETDMGRVFFPPDGYPILYYRYNSRLWISKNIFILLY